MPKQLYRDHYRIRSIRLPYYNYAQNGVYFITICTKMRYPWFGKIRNGIMCVSDIGTYVHNEWLRTQIIRRNVILDTFVVMPDHFHGIVIINNKNTAIQQNPTIEHNTVIERNPVETHCNASLHVCRGQKSSYKNTFGPQYNNLGSIIRGFKGITTKQIHLRWNKNFAWQPRFYERIICDEHELHIVRKYILDNPKNSKRIF